MKTFRKILKLLPPAFVMRIWLARRYGIKVKPSPWGRGVGVVLAVLPYAFTAALSVREESDVRFVKYFLPYEKIKNFVWVTYGIQRGDVTRDHGVIGGLRAILPYGLVLWWDAEDKRLAVSSKQSQKPFGKQPQKPLGPSALLSVKERQALEQQDRIEALTLRMLIMATGEMNK